LEFCEASNEVKIDDLPLVVQKQMGFEIEENV
jgi:hypothetical protein